jgi:hypothetical protein
VYQTGGWTYGVMYDGSVSDNDPSPAPEPGSSLLLGLGLIVVGFIGRVSIRKGRDKRQAR